MLKVFSEFILNLTTEPQTLLLPDAAEVVAVKCVSDKLVLTALLDPDNTYGKLRSFQVCTKDTHVLGNKIMYIGSCETDILGQIYLVEVR
jgi:hypothetical protein